MKNINSWNIQKLLVFLIMFCTMNLTTTAFAASPVDSEDMVMVPGGPFLMGVDKVSNVDIEKMSKRKKLRYLVSRGGVFFSSTTTTTKKILLWTTKP